MEKTIGITEARGKLKEIVEQVLYKGDAFIINRHGKPAAVVVPIDIYEDWKIQRIELFDAVRQIQESNPEADPKEVMRDVLNAQQAIRSSRSNQ